MERLTASRSDTRAIEEVQGWFLGVPFCRGGVLGHTTLLGHSGVWVFCVLGWRGVVGGVLWCGPRVSYLLFSGQFL